MEGQIINLLISLITGAIGGSFSGALLKNYSLGNLGNVAVGIVGGGVGGELLGGTVGTGLIGVIVGAFLGGAILMVLIGLVRRMIAR